MRPTLSLRVVPGGAFLLLLVACIAALVALETEHLLAGELQRSAEDFRELLRPAANRLPEDGTVAGDLRRMTQSTRLRGVEIFSPQGRRIWSAGEPLEIVGYPLDRRKFVTHVTADGTRFEAFWNAEFLQARHGLALRLERDWQRPVRNRLLIASLIVATAFLAAAAAIGHWLGKIDIGKRRAKKLLPTGAASEIRKGDRTK